MIALIDYQAGNLTSVRKAFAAVGAEILTPESPADLRRARRDRRAWRGPFRGDGGRSTPSGARRSARGVHAGMPLLGICLGLQWLFEGSEEAPDVPRPRRAPGTAASCCPASASVMPTNRSDRTPGTVRSPGIVRSAVKVPHVGWNALDHRAAVANPRRRPRRGAGLLHALVRRASHRRVRAPPRARRCPSPASSSTGTCSARSSTRRSPARSD